MKEVKESRKKRKIAVKIESENDEVNIDNDLDVTEDLSLLDSEISKDLNKPITSNKRKKNKKFLIILIPIVLVILILFVIICVFSPTITLNGDAKVKLPYRTEYVEKGATAKYLGKDITDKIKISGSVNTAKVGKYEITYKVKDTFISKEKKRIVNVVDEVKPIIELEGGQAINVCPKEKYKELGYKATDEYDGDLTDKVEIDEKDDSVTYKVKDSSNNETSLVRTLKRVDEEKPIINLNGGNNQTIVLNNNYSEPGYTASDNCSGDLTSKVKTSGTVDTSKEGTYEIKYTVSDEAGNNQTVIRKVTVQKYYPKRSANFSCGEAGVIYLTFDDGPNNTTTTRILDVLKKYGVKATFFVTNTNGGSDSQIKREYDEGHLVALHTSSHDYAKVYASETAYFNDLNAISSRVEKITGIKSTIIRFPGGSSNTVSRHYSSGIMSRLVNVVESKGYSYFDWNVDSRDAEGKPANEIYSNVTRNLSKSRGNVILMHDIKTTTANAIEDIVKYGLNNGYKFKVLDSSVKCWHKTNN